jgi:oligopeptide transport system permease protein
MSERRDPDLREEGAPSGGQATDAPRRPEPELGDAAAAAKLETEQAQDRREGSLWSDAWRQLRRNPLFVVSSLLIVVFIVMAAFPTLFTSTDPRVCSLSNSVQGPQPGHPFGFDVQGCDYYARVIYGARISISIGLVVTVFATLVAVVFGTLAGYFGGLLDTIIARITDIWFALPFILGGIVILSVWDHSFKVVAFVLVILGWPTMLRLMRSSVMSVKEAEYIEAARALGANDLRIMVRHILPNAMAPVIVYATIYVGVVISAEAALSFLGVGLQLPAISWGLMISGAQSRILNSPHLLLFPGAFLSVAVFSFILMGDALRDALDPKLR